MNFFLPLSLVTAAAGLAAVALSGWFSEIDFSLVTSLCIYFFLLTLCTHYMLQRAEKKSAQAFVRYFLGATVLKLLLSVSILVSYAIFNPDQAVAFIILFALYYLLFSGLEIVTLLSASRKKLQP